MNIVKKFFLFIPHSVKRFFHFLKSVRIEMKKVRWATFDEMKKYTYVVVCMTIILALYFWGLDYAIEFIKSLFA